MNSNLGEGFCDLVKIICSPYSAAWEGRFDLLGLWFEAFESNGPSAMEGGLDLLGLWFEAFQRKWALRSLYYRCMIGFTQWQ
jgi:hypothetical protein